MNQINLGPPTVQHVYSEAVRHYEAHGIQIRPPRPGAYTLTDLAPLSDD